MTFSKFQLGPSYASLLRNFDYTEVASKVFDPNTAQNYPNQPTWNVTDKPLYRSCPLRMS